MSRGVVVTGPAFDLPLGELLGDIKLLHTPCTLAATQGAGAPSWVTLGCFQTAPAKQTTLCFFPAMTLLFSSPVCTGEGTFPGEWRCWVPR